MYYEKAFGLSDPLMTLRDPWNRPIRPWIYYTDDNPTIWQYRKQSIQVVTQCLCQLHRIKQVHMLILASIINGCFMFDIKQINKTQSNRRNSECDYRKGCIVE